MIYVINSFLLLISIFLLWKGADWLVLSASKIAYNLGISDLVIGLTVIAIGTSAPEFAVTLSAALQGKTNISVGNVVGSNIFNLGFILGGSAVICAIPTSPKLVWRDGIFLLSTTILLYFLLFGFTFQKTPGFLSQWEGILMLSLLILYITYLLWKKEPMDLEEQISKDKSTWLDWLWVLIGICSVVGGGHLLVHSASEIFRAFGISDWVIGVTVVAAGTSAPEFATTIVAALRQKHGIAIGNLIGSDLFNLLGVLGLAGIIHPMSVSPSAQNSIFILIAMIFVLIIFMRTNWKISKFEGMLLVVVNLIRWIFDFIGK